MTGEYAPPATANLGGYDPPAPEVFRRRNEQPTRPQPAAAKEYDPPPPPLPPTG